MCNTQMAGFNGVTTVSTHILQCPTVTLVLLSTQLGHSDRLTATSHLLVLLSSADVLSHCDWHIGTCPWWWPHCHHLQRASLHSTGQRSGGFLSQLGHSDRLTATSHLLVLLSSADVLSHCDWHICNT